MKWRKFNSLYGENISGEAKNFTDQNFPLYRFTNIHTHTHTHTHTHIVNEMAMIHCKIPRLSLLCMKDMDRSMNVPMIMTVNEGTVLEDCFL